MKRLAITIATVASLASAPTLAGEEDVATVDAVVQTAVDAYSAGETPDVAPIYDIVTDPVALPKCRQYADAAMTAMLLIDAGKEHPESAAIKTLFDYTIDAAIVLRNDCLLAI